MNKQRNRIIGFMNQDYSLMIATDTYFLGTLVNNTLSLSKLLNEIIE